MARIPWRWEDIVDGTVEYMPINPNSGASPTYAKNLSKHRTTAPGASGAVIIFEGADNPVEFSFSGALLTEAHYNFVYRAWAKRHPVRLTDDLGRTFVIYMESFSPQRELNRNHPWKHTYEASAVVIDDGGGSH